MWPSSTTQASLWSAQRENLRGRCIGKQQRLSNQLPHPAGTIKRDRLAEGRAAWTFTGRRSYAAEPIRCAQFGVQARREAFPGQDYYRGKSVRCKDLITCTRARGAQEGTRIFRRTMPAWNHAARRVRCRYIL